MLFLLGDAPAASQDSRSLGWAPLHLLAGVVQRRIHPFSGVVGQVARSR
jgi:hypothetical protein